MLKEYGTKIVFRSFSIDIAFFFPCSRSDGDFHFLINVPRCGLSNGTTEVMKVYTFLNAHDLSNIVRMLNRKYTEIIYYGIVI